jgi:hypothetical protein
MGTWWRMSSRTPRRAPARSVGILPRATPNGASFFLVAARARWDRLIAQKLRAIAHEVKTKRRDYQ